MEEKLDPINNLPEEKKSEFAPGALSEAMDMGKSLPSVGLSQKSDIDINIGRKYLGNDFQLTKGDYELQKSIYESYAREQIDIAKTKADEQGMWSTGANGLVQTASAFLTGIPKYAGYLLDLEATFNLLTGNQADWDNWLSSAMESGNNWVKEQFPIYRHPEGTGGWAEKGYEWFWGDLAPQLGDSMALPLPGAGLIGGTVKGLKYLNAISKAAPATARFAKGLSLAVLSRQTENTAEAAQAANEEYQKVLAATGDEEKAKEAASEAGAFVYRNNWAMILQDIPEYLMLMRGFDTSKTIDSMKLGEAAGIGKWRAFGNKAYNLGKVGLSEGFEEGYQYVISEEGKHFADVKAGLKQDSNFSERLGEYTKSADFWESVFMGSMSSVVQQSLHPKVKEYINKKLDPDFVSERDARINEIRDRRVTIEQSLDAMHKAKQANNPDAYEVAKAQLATNVATRAARVGNLELAIAEIEKFKDATPEELTALNLDENFKQEIPKLVDDMRWIANNYAKNTGKYHASTVEPILFRQVMSRVLQRQVDKTRSLIPTEIENIPRYGDLSMTGLSYFNSLSDSTALVKAITQLKALHETGNSDFTNEIKETERKLKTLEDSIAVIKQDPTLTFEDKKIINSIPVDNIDSLATLKAKQILANNLISKYGEEINTLTSSKEQKKAAEKEAVLAEAIKKAQETPKATPQENKKSAEESREVINNAPADQNVDEFIVDEDNELPIEALEAINETPVQDKTIKETLNTIAKSTVSSSEEIRTAPVEKDNSYNLNPDPDYTYSTNYMSATWKSYGNDKATAEDRNDLNKTRSEFFESNRDFSKYEVRLTVDYDFNLESDPSYKAISTKVKNNQPLTEEELNRLPIRASIYLDGVQQTINNIPIYVHLRSSDYLFRSTKVDLPTAESAKKILNEIRNKVIEADKTGKTISTKIKGLSNGYFPISKREARNNPADVLKQDPEEITLAVSNGDKYVDAKGDVSALSKYITKTTGMLYSVAYTPSGNAVPMRLFTTNLSTSEAKLVANLYFDLLSGRKFTDKINSSIIERINKSNDPRVSNISDVISLDTATYSDIINFFVYQTDKNADVNNPLRLDSGNLIVGSKKFTVQDFKDNKKFQEIVTALEGQIRQVNRKRLNTPEYNSYLLNTGVLYTNTDVPLLNTAVSPLVQPLISFSDDIIVEESELTTTKNTSSDIENKKADIERRRQEELPTINVYWGSAETPTNTRVLSNLAPRKFTYQSKEYGSVEHAYQTLKSGEFDQVTYDKYVKAGGYGIKIKGKQVNKEFDNLQLMKDLVVESFKQNPEQAKLLLKYKDFTHTTNEIIDKAFLEGLKLAKYDAELAALQTTTNPFVISNEVTNTPNASEFINYSGAAKGSDTEWENIGKEFGIGKQVNYNPDSLQKLTVEQRQEVENAYQEAVKNLGRKPLSPNTFSGGLVRRDYLQAKAAGSVFAVIEGFDTNNLPKGGTAYAITMATAMNKPVYIFNQEDNKWYEAKYLSKDEGGYFNGFEEINYIPKLTPKYAGIGTRKINKNGKQAIRDVYNATFKSPIINQPTANTNTTIDGIKEALSQLNKKTLVVDPNDSNYYINSDNPSERYKRVSLLKGSFEGNPEAANRGTIIDSMLRDFIQGKITTIEDMSKAYNAHPLKESTNGFSKDFLKNLFDIFSDVEKATYGMELIANIPTLWGTIKGEEYAGTIDLLGIDPTGKVYIIDLKTSSRNRREESDEFYQAYREGDSIQQSAYAELLRQQTGINISNVVVFPIQVSKVKGKYSTAKPNKDTNNRFTMKVDIDRSIFPVNPTPKEKPKRNISDEDRKKFDKLFKQIDSPVVMPDDLIDLDAELAWYKKNLPQVPIEVVKELIAVNSKGDKAYGMFFNNMVTISEGAKKGTVYHEAFHAVFNLMLTPEEREIILNEASKKYGIPRSYTQDKPKGKDTKYQKASDIGIIASEKTIRDIAARISDRIGIPVEFEADRNKRYKGKIENNIAYINLAYATLDTPIHEILGHPIIRVIKGKIEKGYNQYKITDLSDDENAPRKFQIEYLDKEGDIQYNFFDSKEEVDKFVKDNKLAGQDKQIGGNVELYQNLLKELEYGRGKEVLDRIKKDYKVKNKALEKNNDYEYEGYIYTQRGSNFSRYNKSTGKFEETTEEKHLEALNHYYENNKVLYTLEEQQEEAIVELLGMMTAEKLDATRDGKLISLLKRLLKEIKAFIKDLLRQREVEINKLPDNMTIGDLADLLAYSNSKLILPGNEVVYTTPDNMKFKTYQEASNHISELAKNAKDIDLDNIKVEKSESNFPQNFYKFKGKEFTDTDGKIIRKNENDKWQIEQDFGGDLGVKWITIDSQDAFERYNEKYGRNNSLKGFIEKNKEYEQSKEIIEEWKKVNNIQYNPEEVYSRGQEFVSVVGAYSNFDVNLMMQNLLHHIEDNEKAGGKFTISAFTKPVDRTIGHLEGEGGKIKFKIYPQSKDILWAANKDVYSGSVWDASEKVNKDKKSELLGVSYSKYPSLENVNAVQPNLAYIVDNLAHHHNELGITLTGNNFRLEYDEDIPYQTKKIVNSINSILDQKYGKLVKPEIKLKNDKVSYAVYDEYGDPDLVNDIIVKRFENFEEAQKYADLKNSDEGYTDSYGARYKVVKEKVGGIQPTQTKDNLKESIESVKNKNTSIKENQWAVEPYVEGEYAVYTYMGEFVEGQPTFTSLEEANKWLKENQPKEKEYTEQVLINTKIAKLKEVAKKYPRSLIRSEVRPIDDSPFGMRISQFEDDELPFQKIPSEDKYRGLDSEVSVEYLLKSVDILQSDKAKQVFEKGQKNKWDLNKILTELAIPKEQKQLILNIHWNILNKARVGIIGDIREEIITDLLANYSYTIEINTAKAGREFRKEIYDPETDEFYVSDELEIGKTELPTQYYSNLTVPGGTNYTENEIAIPGVEVEELIPSSNPNTHIVWHGSDADIEQFESKFPKGYFSKIKGGADNAIFFSKDKAPKGTVYGDRKYQNQYEVTINNPLIVDTKTGYSRDKEGFKDLVDRAIKNGNDGIIIKNVHDNFTTDVYISLNSANIKKASYKTVRKGAITPSIKGHAQFSTDNGIGWFRSDDKLGDKYSIKATNRKTGIEQNMSQNMPLEEATEVAESFKDRFDNVRLVKYEEGDNIKTRRILEVQSDLFQKGREERNLAGKLTPKDLNFKFEKNEKGELGFVLNDKWFESQDEAMKYRASLFESKKDNQFLQLLNKDNNWVTFFVKSIIQDSAKKGYEKVLFPKGDTASKVEGHETLATEIRRKDKQIKTYENRLREEQALYDSYKKELELFESDSPTMRNLSLNIIGYKNRIEEIKAEKDQLKSQGIEKLKPIYDFYENKVGNILKKQGYNPNVITDEYGNEWYEVEITPEIKDKKVLLSKVGEDKYKGLDSDTILEEKLAEDFELMREGINVFKTEQTGNFFSRLWNLIKSIFSRKLTTAKLYDKINRGYYANKPLNLSNNTEALFKRKVEGFTTSQLDSVIKTLTYVVFHYDTNADLRNLNDLNIDNARKYLLYMIEKSEDLGDQDAVDRYSKILDALCDPSHNSINRQGELFKAFEEQLNAYGIIAKIPKENSKKATEQEITQDDEIQSEMEDKGLNLNPIYMRDSMDDAATTVKLLLATIPSIKAIDEQNNYIYNIDPFTGLPFMEDFEDMAKKVKSILADIVPVSINGERQEPFNQMIVKLKAESLYYPSLRFLADKLDKSDETVQTQFFNAISGTKINYVSTFFNGDAVTVNVGNPDVQSADKRLRDEWSENFIDVHAHEELGSVKLKPKHGEAFEKLYKSYKENLMAKETILNVELMDKTLYLLNKTNISMSYNGLLRAIDYAPGDNRLEKLRNIFTSTTINLDKLYTVAIPKIASKGFQIDVATGDVNSPLADEKSVLYLASHQAHLDSAYGKQSILMTEGNQYSVYSKHNLITREIAAWKQNPELLKELRDNHVYTKHSLFLNDMIKDPRVLKDFKATYYGHFKIDTLIDNEGKNQSDLTESEETLDRFSRMLTGTFINLAKADKPTDIQFQGIQLRRSLMTLQGNKYVIGNKAEVLKIFMGYILDEHLRAKAVWEDLNVKKISDKDKIAYLHTQKNGLKHYLFPSLTYGADPNNPDPYNLYGENGEPLVFDIKKLMENKPLVDHIESQFKKQVHNELNRWIELKLINKGDTGQFVNNVLPRNILKGYENNTESDAILKAAADYVLNGIIGSVEMSKLFTGDPALYKSKETIFEDFAKRVPATSASGYDFRIIDNKYTYKSVVIKNVMNENSFYQDETFKSNYAELLKLSYPEKTDEELKDMAETMLSGYKKVNQTDAQAWITLDAYKIRMRGLGKWTKYHELVFKAIKKYDANPTTENLRKAQYLSLKHKIGMQPLKTVHTELMSFGPYRTMQYNKQSEAVLNPLLTRGTDLDKLRKAMEAQEIDHVVVEDGKKAGAIGVLTIHDKDGNVLDNIDFTGYGRDLQYSRLGLQQDLPYKGMKDTLLGSQVKKNVLANVNPDYEYMIDGKPIKGSELVQHLFDVDTAVSNIGAMEIMKELGYNPEDKTVDYNKVVEILRKGMTERPTIYNAIEALDFGLPLEAVSGFRRKFQNQLLSAVTKSTVKIKTFGGSFIQMSDFGYHKLDSKHKQGVIWLVEPSRLKPPRAEKVDGKWKVYPGQVLLPYTAIKDIPNYNELSTQELIKRIDPRLLKGLGYRIPNQDTSSNDIMEVVGILPPSAGDTVIAYTEITTKTGSDFDIDKQYMSFPAYEVVDGKLKYIEFNPNIPLEDSSAEALNNRRLEIYESVFLDPKTFTSLVKPLDDDTLKNDILKLFPPKKLDDLEWFTPYNQMQIKRQFQGGKFGVGQTANMLTDHPLAQLAKLEYSLYFGGLKGNVGTSLNSIMNEDGVLISSVLAMFLNAYVDIAKDPFIERGNHNTTTANVVFTLVRAGVSLEWINRFIGQPVLKEYVKQTEAKDNFYQDINPLEETLKKFGLDPTDFKEVEDLTTKDILKSDLEDSIKNPNFENYKNTQYKVLKLFLSLKSISQTVNDQLRYSKSDTVGATKTIIEARVFKMNKDRLESNPELVNFSEKFNNTSLGAYYKNSVELALDMFSNLFLSETKAVKNTVEGILGYLGADPDEQQRVADNVYAYLMAEKYGVDREEFNSLFYGDKSMVRRFSALKYGLNEEIKSRPLIKYLTTKRGGTRLPDFIGVTKSKQVSVHVQNMIYRDWEDMLSSSDPEIKKFAEDLIKYSYLTSGFMNGLYTFHEYIPTSWMKDNNLDKFISTKMQELDKNEFVMENFINQYYRNNPGLITQLKMKSPFKETIPSPTVEVNGIKVPSMVGVKMSDGGNKYINSVTGAKPYLMYSNNLYKLKGYRIEDGILKGAEYVITEKLGYNALGRKIIEYYPGQANPRSAVKSNVVNISNADIKLIQDKTKDLLPHKEFIEKVNESSNELPFGILPKNDNNSEESDGLTRVCEIE